MTVNYAQTLAQHFNLQEWQTKNAIELYDEGNTIPFIARYRKEAHGGLDDQLLRELFDRLTYLRNLDARREEVRGLIDGLGKMTEEIGAALDAALTLSEIDDIYRPYRPKRKTRASIAKEKSLEPLALAIFEQQLDSPTPEELAAEYINEEKGVETIEDALAGARDIIAEMVSDDAGIRRRLRVVIFAQALLESKASDPSVESPYESYYDFSELVSKIAGHRVLAIDRGEREKILKASVVFDKEKGVRIASHTTVKEGSACTEQVKDAVRDAYERLIFPSIEREVRSSLTDDAAEKAIRVFALNLGSLLMQPPVKGKIALGLDPGYRTGCKVAVVDPTGRVLDTDVIFPVPEFKRVEEARRKVTALIEKHNVEVIAIGNGTASGETEHFTAELIQSLNRDVRYLIVNEAGASVYSASKLAAEEFPQFDLTLRSAVSIARRMQDPLAELVKIDPKSIGVGQYQHDMPPKRLEEALGGVVEGCVNRVGVDLNTASFSLLGYVAGINTAIAKNIVKYREANGAFSSRVQLLKVPRLGAKAYEQCAGFLRVPESANPLDRTGVHPESYSAADKLIKAYGMGKVPEDMEQAANEIGVGVPTLEDIIKELARPGRDPRDELPQPVLRQRAIDISELSEGMVFDGTVRNVIDFGVFVDIGVHQDGLVHISQVCDKFIRHPSEIVKVGDQVKVQVLGVDMKKKRISLTMKVKS